MKSLLSIQSHVVHGYVGGKAATFPLQCRGWDVDALNTVNFSNHTGYGSYKGSALAKADLEALLEGITNINVHYHAIITGYIPNAELIASIASYIEVLRQQLVTSAQPAPLYLLDPVMGDQGYLYVDPSCIVLYKDLLATRLVDIITPNQFELELLCDCKIKTLSDLKASIRILHQKHGVKFVVVSSLTDIEGLDLNYIYCAASVAGTAESDISVFKVAIIKSYFTGVGDLFSALLLDCIYTNSGHRTDAHVTKTLQRMLDRSVSQVLTIMHQTLELTHAIGSQACKGAADGGTINDADSMRHYELKVVQSKDFFGYDGEGEYASQRIDCL